MSDTSGTSAPVVVIDAGIAVFAHARLGLLAIDGVGKEIAL
jgi:hypothetical protein